MMTLDRSEAETDMDSDVSEIDAVDLRLLFVIDSRFPGLGGAEAQAVKLAHALKERGAHVEYIAPMVIAGEYEGLTEYDGIPITFIKYPHVKLLGSVVMMAKFGAFLIKNRSNFDFMHVHVTRLLAATAGVVRPFCKIPIITKISGFFEFEGGILDQKKRLNPLNMLMRLAMRNIDHVQTISKQTQSKLLDSGFKQSQIALIPNGIDTSQPPSAMPDSEEFRVGYCGRLREVKGVHVLLEGYALAKKERPDLNMKIVLAGSGSSEHDLRTQVSDLGIADQIEFLGLVEDTAPFYSDLDLYVQPSFAEGLPNSVIEAMHAARAVLATDIGGNHDLIEDTVSGYLFPAGDAQMLAGLLIKCYDDQADNLRMGANGRKLIEDKYGMDGVIDQLVGVYRGQ